MSKKIEIGHNLASVIVMMIIAIMIMTGVILASKKENTNKTSIVKTVSTHETS